MKKIFFSLLVCLFVNPAFSQTGWFNPDPSLQQGTFIRDIRFFDTDTGVFSGWNTLMHTVDGGTNWLPLNVDECIWDQVYYWNDPDTGWSACGQGNIAKTTDGGLTWNIINTDYTSSQYVFTKMYFADDMNGWLCGVNNTPDGDGFMLHTTNGGISWSSQTLPVADGIMDMEFITATEAYACGGEFPSTGVVLYTNNGGLNWTVKHTVPGILYGITTSGSTHIWACGASGIIAHSNNSGTSWATQNSGTSTEMFRDVVFFDNTQGWAVGSGNYMVHTTNGGTTWIPQDFQPADGYMCIAPVSATEVWVSAGRQGQGVEALLIHTTDGGTNWTSRAHSTLAHMNEIEFVDADTGWTVGEAGKILYTNNSGNSWKAQEPYSAYRFNSLSTINNMRCWTAGENGTLMKTINGGNTWTTVSSGTTTNINSIDFAGVKFGWLAGEDGLIKATTDSGNTWLTQTSGTTEDLRSIFFIDSLTGWATGNDAVVLHTVNGGATWVPQDAGVTENNWYFNEVHFSDENNGWLAGKGVYHSPAGGGDSDAGILYKTTDGGSSWQPVFNASMRIPVFNDVFFMDADTGWIATNWDLYTGSILRTTDGGDTWMIQGTVPPYTGSQSVCFKNGTGWVALGSADMASKPGGILKTTDLGGTGGFLSIPQPSKAGNNFLHVYPNPFHDVVTIVFDNESNAPHTFELYTMQGALVHTVTGITGDQLRFDRNGFSNGTYMFRLTQNGLFKAAGRLVIE